MDSMARERAAQRKIATSREKETGSTPAYHSSSGNTRYTKPFGASHSRILGARLIAHDFDPEIYPSQNPLF